MKMELNKIILDACCGNRMMWVNKKHPLVIYHDQREEVNPDIVGDFRDMKTIASNSIKLVVIDPPHDIYHRKVNENASFQKNFGNLNPDTWEEDLKKGLAECYRVLEDYGVLIFKWNTHDAKINRIMPLLPAEPLFMNKLTKLNSHNSETIWFCFMKLPQKECKHVLFLEGYCVKCGKQENGIK